MTIGMMVLAQSIPSFGKELRGCQMLCFLTELHLPMTWTMTRS